MFHPGRVREKLTSLVLSKAAEEYISFKGSVIEETSLEDLAENIETLINHVIKERLNAETRYRKLFELHNKLVEVNSKRKEHDEPQSKYRLADENSYLRAELKKASSARL